MNREQFSTFISTVLEDVIQFAEEKAAQKLPRRFAFQWLGRSNPRITENIVEQVVKRVFIDEEHIYPCFDLGVGDLLEDGSLLIVGNVSGHAPRPFGQNWTGREGPFVPIVGISFLNRMAGVKDSFSPDKPFSFITPDMNKARTPWHVRPLIPKLPDKLREDLGAITLSRDGDLTYWPCAARMKDGTVLVCVYVVPEGPCIKHGSVYPQQDLGRVIFPLQMWTLWPRARGVCPQGLRTSCTRVVNLEWDIRSSGSCLRMAPVKGTVLATPSILSAIQTGKGKAMWLMS